MWRLQIANRVNELIHLQIKDQYFRILFCRGEQPISCKIQAKMVEVAVVEIGQRDGLRKFWRPLVLSPSTDYK